VSLITTPQKGVGVGHVCMFAHGDENYIMPISKLDTQENQP
jgi:hypothetical protein